MNGCTVHGLEAVRISPQVFLQRPSRRSLLPPAPAGYWPPSPLRSRPFSPTERSDGPRRLPRPVPRVWRSGRRDTDRTARERGLDPELAAFRRRYPEYDDLSDDDVRGALGAPGALPRSRYRSLRRMVRSARAHGVRGQELMSGMVSGVPTTAGRSRAALHARGRPDPGLGRTGAHDLRGGRTGASLRPGALSRGCSAIWPQPCPSRPPILSRG